jgi:two-component system NtrC family sensor kinase
VFLNLITNAIDAHDGIPYGTISITTRSDDQNQGVQAVFADTGNGIDPENLEKVFDPYSLFFSLSAHRPSYRKAWRLSM